MKNAACLAMSMGLLATATTADAITFTYEYTGHPLEVTSVEDAEAVGAPLTLPAYSGLMMLEEDNVPGGTLRNAALSFTAYGGPYGDTLPIDGLQYFSVFPFPALAMSTLSFTTDSERNITSWVGDFLDGPPDGRITTAADYYYLPYGTPIYYESTVPGSWSAVPAPAAFPLLFGALAALGLMARRRTFSGSAPEA